MNNRSAVRDRAIIALHHETEWYQAPPELKPALKNQAQRFPARDIVVRRLDHLNCLASDIKANRIHFDDYLGCRLTEQIVMNDGIEAGMWMTVINKSYDFAFTRDHIAVCGPMGNKVSLRWAAGSTPACHRHAAPLRSPNRDLADA